SAGKVRPAGSSHGLDGLARVGKDDGARGARHARRAWPPATAASTSRSNSSNTVQPVHGAKFSSGSAAGSAQSHASLQRAAARQQTANANDTNPGANGCRDANA